MTAPTFTNLTNGAAAGATSGVTASVAPTGDRLILVSVHAYLSTGSVQPATPSVTGNGITYTLVQAQNTDDAGTDRATMWVFRGMASSPTSGAITISFGAVSQTRIFWSVDQSDANVNTSGTNGSGAVVQSTGVTLAVAGTSASVNYPTAMRSSSSGFSAWGHQVQEGKTPRTSWTELADNSSQTLAPLETQYMAATDTAGSVTWATSSRGGGIILEIASPPVLLAAYNYDESSGNILDRSGNSRDVTFGGSMTRVSGHTSTALSQSTAAADSNGPSLTGMQTGSYTIEGWVNRSSNSIDGWLMEYKQSGSGDRGILMTSGNIQSRCKNVAGTVFTVQTTLPATGTPYHVACTNDGNMLRLFINGSEITTGTVFTGGVRTNSTSAPLFDTLGSETYLDDARYYDGALSAAQITADMGTPVSGGGISGTAAVTQANQTSSASGQLGYSGTSAATEANDTSSASGTVVNPVTGTSAANQANQTSTASGQLGYSGNVARTQANQTSSAAGQLGYTGTATPTQAAQTSAASGTFTTGGSFAGSAAVTQANQTASAAGQLGYSGTSARTQANNTSAASGTVVNPVTGTASPSQANQFSIANGILRYTGTVAAGEAADIATATGVISGPISGTAAVVQANQTVVAVGTFTALVSFGTASAATGQAPTSSAAAVLTAAATAGTAALATASSGSAGAPAASSGAMTVPTATGG